MKQIVGGSLSSDESSLQTNYVSQLGAAAFAEIYKENNATGAHIIMLGPGNEKEAEAALWVWQGAFQIGGGMTDENIKAWLDAGAEKV